MHLPYSSMPPLPTTLQDGLLSALQTAFRYHAEDWLPLRLNGLALGFVNEVWGRYYFDTFIDKAKKGEIFKGNKILNKNSGKIGFDTFRLKLVESNWTLIPFLHDFDEVLG